MHVPLWAWAAFGAVVVVMLAIDLLAWRVVAANFDRERLITGRSA